MANKLQSIFIMKTFILLTCILYSFISSAQLTHPFEARVQAFEKRHNPNSHPILFIGSSTIEGWKGIEKRFSSFEARNYGISGSQVSDLFYFRERLILKAFPKAIVIYSGDNDLASGKTTDEVAKDFDKLISGIRSEQYQTIFLFSVKISPKRIDNKFKIINLNNRLRELALSLTDVVFLDFNSQILDENGMPDKQYFSSDLLHFNETGYKVLEKMLTLELIFHPECY